MKNKIRQYLLINVSIWIVLSVAMIWGGIYWLNFYTGLGKEVVVPSIVNLPVAEAIDTLTKYNLTYKIQDTQRSSSVPSNFVLYQYPPPRQRTKERRTIFLIVSALTTRKNTLPNLIGQNVRMATFKLQELGIRMKPIAWVDSVILGEVVSVVDKDENPIAEGTVIASRDSIRLYVGSKKVQMINVPLLVGMSEVEARLILQSGKLQLGIVHYKPKEMEENAADPYIVRQYPIAIDSLGNVTSVPENTAIDVWVE